MTNPITHEETEAQTGDVLTLSSKFSQLHLEKSLDKNSGSLTPQPTLTLVFHCPGARMVPLVALQGCQEGVSGC